MDVSELLSKHGGIKLDICCGGHKQGPDWIGLDIQELPGVDIVWDVNIHPWPLPDDCALAAIASHVLEHIPKVAIDGGRTRFPLIEFMNEVWRVLKPDGQFAIAAPHGASPGFLQDPTHTAQFNHMLFAYFDPLAFEGFFYSYYRPKPWKIKQDIMGQHEIFYDMSGNVEVLLVKRREDWSYDRE